MFMLKTNSIKSVIQPSDGNRISIMSRHTLSDGISPDPDISSESYHEWWPELSPPAFLVGAYYKRELSWSDFEVIYKEHIRRPEIAKKIIELIELTTNEVITVLCIEDKPDRCHRRLLAEECLILYPELAVEIH